MRSAAEIIESIFEKATHTKPISELYEDAIREAQREAIKEAAELVVIGGNPEIAKQKILQLLNQIQ